MIVTPCVDLCSCFCRAISPSLGFCCLLRILGVCVSCGLPGRECPCWVWPLGISKYWEWTFRSGDGLEGEWGGLEVPLKEGKLRLLEGSDFMATMAWGLSCKRVVLPVRGWDKGMGWGRRLWERHCLVPWEWSREDGKVAADDLLQSWGWRVPQKNSIKPVNCTVPLLPPPEKWHQC